MNIVISRREKLLEQIEKEGACSMQEKEVQREMKWREIMGMGGVSKNFSSNKAFNRVILSSQTP